MEEGVSGLEDKVEEG
jgi:hypothetical protein